MDQDYNIRKKVEFYDKYPLCFPSGEPCCGFSIGYGWWPRIKKLCEDITEVLNRSNCQGFQVEQVKEKFGGLRFYIPDSIDNKEIKNLITEAESDCSKICETCGNEGGANNTPEGKWIKTLCAECAKSSYR